MIIGHFSAEDRGGRNDEAYTHGYPWRTEFFLLEGEHGDCQFDF